MQNTIKAIAQNFLQSELGKEVVNDFFKMKGHSGWKFMQGFILELGNHISNEVLSRRFQKLPNEEKLIQLAAYSKVSDFLKFFANPIKVFGDVQKLKQHNKRVGESPAEARKRRQRELTERSLG